MLSKTFEYRLVDKFIKFIMKDKMILTKNKNE
jgi:hypothetical protein